jgi:hypothetical protein
MSLQVRLRAARQRMKPSKQVSASRSCTSDTGYCIHIPCGRYFISQGSFRSMAINMYLLSLDEPKLPCTLPKVVATSHFPLVVVIRSLTCLLTCRALTVAVAVVYACTVCQSRLRCVLGSFVCGELFAWKGTVLVDTGRCCTMRYL